MTNAGKLVIRPLQWSALPELPDALPLDAGDVACLDELRHVLARHGKLGRFAVHLAHRHFDLAAGEALIETPAPDGRTQHVTVGKLADYPHALPTTWLFNTDAADVYCVCTAVSPYALDACAVHARSSTPSKTGQEQDRLSEKNYQKEKARQDIGWPAGGHGLQIERARQT